MDRLFRKCRIKNTPARVFAGEMFGTFLATFLIDSSAFQFALGGSARFGLSFAMGIAITFGTYSCGMISPLAPLNPNAAIGFALSGFIPFKMLPLYYIAELLGAFMGHLWSYGLYHEALINFGKIVHGGNAFLTPDTVFMCSLPKTHTSTPTQVFDIFSSVTVFIFITLVIVDVRNYNIPLPAQPLMVGINVMLISLCLGFNTGGPLNMAIDFTGRIVSSFLGWGGNVWSHGNYYFWIPIVMGQLGAIVAALLYHSLIGPNLLRSEEEDETEEKSGDQEEKILRKGREENIT